MTTCHARHLKGHAFISASRLQLAHHDILVFFFGSISLLAYATRMGWCRVFANFRRRRCSERLINLIDDGRKAVLKDQPYIYPAIQEMVSI